MSLAKKPTDVELMMYFDGELAPAERDAVAAYLAESTEAASKVKALGLGGEMIAHLTTSSPSADGIALEVMAAIAKAPRATKDAPSDLELMIYVDGEIDPERRDVIEAHLASSSVAAKKVQALRVGGEMLLRRATRPSAAADGVADAVMAVIAEEAARTDERASKIKSIAAPPKKSAANDNARRIYATAALALAAAAALLVWGRGAEPTRFAEPAMSAEVAASVTVAAPTPPPSNSVARTAPSGEEDAAEPEPIHGVEVAAVEFGGKMGSIFYVPTGESGSANTTTVVWLAEETGDE